MLKILELNFVSFFKVKIVDNLETIVELRYTLSNNYNLK